jgi:hypothetical protein
MWIAAWLGIALIAGMWLICQRWFWVIVGVGGLLWAACSTVVCIAHFQVLAAFGMLIVGLVSWCVLFMACGGAEC